MNKEQRAGFRRSLRKWYLANKRDLPWRETDDPYCIWVSEVMLQQTQVDAVIPYYHRFLRQFPTLKHLADAPLQNVLKAWEGMGYYARARNLHRAAKTVVKELDGRLPRDTQALLGLPGVGDYIARAVASIAFNQKEAVVDGNVKRVLARLFMVETPINTGPAHKEFRCLADELLDRRDPAQFNQAMMELGALVCTPKNPNCIACPVSAHCQVLQNRVVEAFPKRVKKKRVPTHNIAVGVIQKEKKVLITLRKPDGLLGGLWEFPGGKVKRGETSTEACKREIKEEVGLDVVVSDHIAQVKHAYTHFKIVMEVYRCAYKGGEVILGGPVDFKWVTLKELTTFPFPKANNKFIPKLADALT